ncbi:substrate-binding domain-containing protein [Actinoplanes couchii]|uniref:Sugar ABC transporter n=1 Tax=Actinoplanes couchii TaxID=403638 RepID=A0ABQ3XDF5_9ACTN|nr:substrate-binding domain-containing protein [Actinoplanes couchii]MDR6317053.1 fructose transport system substrate-binding protein [Actinoplanes couchii]GID56548.1 sugar ABC transporter [Actinoplanes couchii]
MTRTSWHRRALTTLTVSALLIPGLAACGGSEGTPAAEGGEAKVTLILKDLQNPFFTALADGAKAEAAKNNVELTVVAAKKDGDEQGQIDEIESAVLKGQDGILILPSGPAVNKAMTDARAQGVTVIALDTPPDPIDTADITFATDNFEAGKLIGEWSKANLAGKPAVIALLDQFSDRTIQTDLNRDQGFLEGMGIDLADKTKKGDEAKTGNYAGGTYTIACQEPTTGAEDGGRTAMENCLTKNKDINLVYTINEPSASGAYKALQAAGMQDKVTIVSIDGSCDGVKNVGEGVIAATSMQFPVKMAELGVKAVADKVAGKALPAVSDGLDFYNTGTELITDKAQAGVTSTTTADATKTCW